MKSAPNYHKEGKSIDMGDLEWIKLGARLR